MKTKLFSALAGLAVTLALLTPAFANHRTGSFALPELLSAGDFNGDGNLDLAVSSTGFDNVALYAGDGSGGLTLTGHLASDTLTKGLDVADINGDGRLDLVTATAWGYDVIVHLGDGAGGFGHRDQIYDGDGEPTRVILRDFNNDGKLDIAVNAPDEGKLLIYLNNLKGGFSVPAKEVAGIPHLFGLASGDFNKDGNLDLAVSSVQSPGALTGNALVLLGDGTGNFTQSANVTIKPLPTSVATGDLDNDGNVDFVVAGAQPGNTTGNFITTFLGDGTGKVTQKQLIDLGTGCLMGKSLWEISMRMANWTSHFLSLEARYERNPVRLCSSTSAMAQAL